MLLNTKFSLGERVYIIGTTSETTKINCPFCAGKGKIEVTSTDGAVTKIISCPICYGQGITTHYAPPQYNIIRSAGLVPPFTIGRVTAEWTATAQDLASPPLKKTQYMCYETGVGSGTCWAEEDLFRTEEEAQKECTKRNARTDIAPR
jgi:anaerobic selenocysteine-containing dehydrogenase